MLNILGVQRPFEIAARRLQPKRPSRNYFRNNLNTSSTTEQLGQLQQKTNWQFASMDTTLCFIRVQLKRRRRTGLGWSINVGPGWFSATEGFSIVQLFCPTKEDNIYERDGQSDHASSTIVQKEEWGSNIVFQVVTYTFSKSGFERWTMADW
ncbi:hypothetical protein DAPPUDRAFT_238800 [Daphnia pulex]|uniref:Uncharacterized protein n=1 Tax=Daphnia pulex TaxID=6669 RepID=E9G7F4_DAPPU|nr:hypothetical protein DAPPUDRAFT_238800 [Daphnia pulex]|eukprot:EFX84654.1 hypothetical protein DAPPUDRAFT_238800 [Daphnia pulex]